MMYAEYAFSGAIDEVSLVLFTTLAPSGVLAYALMALPFIFFYSKFEPALMNRLEKFLSIPLLVSMVGLIVSATHLGNPENVLHVLSGFGRSPLSNEVVCAVLFLGGAGVFWLTSFSVSAESGKRTVLRRAAAAVVSLLGLVFIAAISYAYDADTIITWNAPFVPISIWLNAFIGGPLLAILGFRISGFYVPHHRFGRAYLFLSIVGLVANAVLYAIWGSSLSGFENSMTSADSLVPLFMPLLVVFVVLSIVGICLAWRAVKYEDQTPVVVPVVSVLCAFVGIFAMRFCFYMSHMTVGLGL